MAARRKIDIDKLKALHSKGLTLTAIAEKLGVTKGAVSKQLKKLDLAVIKNVVLESAVSYIEFCKHKAKQIRLIILEMSNN